ncbi:hypothetical protein ABZ490_40220 [Streptomyces sp. NPDC005811]|uniref:hypothetical protein n=1 Tax=Streptomyces sp. NPDC005811 TaxID=3154565 RepID=UPI0033E83064
MTAAGGEQSTVITLVEGEGKGLSFTVDWPPDEVEAARRSCAAGQPNLVALTIVLAFLQHLGAPCSPRELADRDIWPLDDIATLFDMLGMPLTEGWTAGHDAELERLLAQRGDGRG